MNEKYREIEDALLGLYSEHHLITMSRTWLRQLLDDIKHRDMEIEGHIQINRQLLDENQALKEQRDRTLNEWHESMNVSDSLVNTVEAQAKEIEQLKVENEDLKGFLNVDKAYADRQELQALREENLILQMADNQIVTGLIEDRARYRDALEEIKSKEWELAGEATPSYLIAHLALIGNQQEGN